MNMVRKKRMTGIAARMIVINLYMASLPKSIFGRPIPRGAGSRWIAYHYANKSPPRRNLCSQLPLSGGSTHGLVPRDKAPWKSPQPTRHPPHGCQSGRFAGTADPRLGELAMCRPLTRGILKRYGTRITSFSADLTRCTSSTTEQGWPFLQLALWSLDDEFAEQSSALR